MIADRKRWTRWLLLALPAGAAAYFALSAGRSSEPPLRFETAAVDRGPIVAKITATGTLSALVTVQVGSQVSGRVQEILADFNSQVTKGQVIARLDPQLFKAALEQAKANSAAAQANLARSQVQALEAERQYQRTKSLADQKLVAQADAETAEANAAAARAAVEAARASVQQTRAALNQAQVNLTYTTIVSPIDGVVISRSVDVGQTVAASLQAPTLFVIAEDLRRMQVDASVSEADVGKLEAGMAASFTVDAYPGLRFRGQIRQVRNAAQTVQNVVTYNAVIDVENPELKLRPGMTASVAFVYAEKRDVLRLPNAALRFKPTEETLGLLEAQASPRDAASGPVARAADARRPSRRPGGAPDEKSTRTVYVLRNGKAQPIEVVTGISDGSLTEIVSGDLREGDSLVTDVAGGADSGGGALPGMRPSRGGRAYRMF